MLEKKSTKIRRFRGVFAGFLLLISMMFGVGQTFLSGTAVYADPVIEAESNSQTAESDNNVLENEQSTEDDNNDSGNSSDENANSANTTPDDEANKEKAYPILAVNASFTISFLPITGLSRKLLPRIHHRRSNV